ncbi:NRDE family protein [Oceanobacillus sp. CFH 90083]|uniref:NRDE family protein n=1 Tax=Oceanobacillus sp. CFH 90083 TaxID=2592336 RepID=UPI00128C1A57|nr:NRDE family protein [Oceanobacillus sp. CFH 90083]
MCLITFAYHTHPQYKLILLSNRDEFYNRPTLPAAFWEDKPDILAGRDLLQQGTWLAVSKQGKFAAVTNYRDPALPEVKTFSRGELPVNFLLQNIDGAAFLSQLSKNRHNYAGYNILFGDKDTLYHYNNVYNQGLKIEAGIHGLSNDTLNTSWPKVERSKSGLAQYIQTHTEMKTEDLLHLLKNRTQADDKSLPQTGIPADLEKALSSIFIATPEYGTRASTILLIDYDNNVIFIEKTYDKEDIFQHYQFFIQSD